MSKLSNQQLEFVKQVKEMCRHNYDRGGDTIIECFTDEEIVAQFKSLDDVREYCGLRLEQAANRRWGEDFDPELEALDRFKEWEDK